MPAFPCGTPLWPERGAARMRGNRGASLRGHVAPSAPVRSGSVDPPPICAPGIVSLAVRGRGLASDATRVRATNLTEAASRYFRVGVCFGQAGLEPDAERARAAAFECVRQAVAEGVAQYNIDSGFERWLCDSVCVSAPARIDLGGGWSDTPPFCLDRGGRVLNVAVGLNGAYPISATVRRIREGVVRCISFAGGAETTAEYRTVGDVLATASAGSPFLLPATALQLIGVARRGKSMVEKLSAMGGGIETRTLVRLPIGSGLGVSSILAAVLLCALAALAGVSLPQSALVSLVLLMEQMMGTGGGWQDQAGAIYPGAKLLTSGPGLQQRLRADIIPLTDARRNDFTDRLVLYYTGIHRKSRTLGARIVGKYLARDRVTLRVLDSIRTLAAEMAHAMKEGEWDCLGRQMDRHWQLNRILDPGTSDAPIEALLSDLAPYLAGAKLAGAGGGGFLLLLARGAEEASFLRNRLVSTSCLRNGALYGFYVSEEGLRVTKE